MPISTTPQTARRGIAGENSGAHVFEFGNNEQLEIINPPIRQEAADSDDEGQDANSSLASLADLESVCEFSDTDYEPLADMVTSNLLN